VVNVGGFPCNQALTIAGPVGALEALTACPAAAPVAATAMDGGSAGREAVPTGTNAGAVFRPTAVILHPHPLHGGTMQNKVVHTLARAFGELGVASVRFNFRGVGASAGGFAHGAGETEDALAVIEWVRAQRPGAAVWLAGFSFGAYVALRAAAPAQVSGLITVAPAVNLYDFSALAPPPCPWLLIQGEADEVVPVEAVRAWLSAIAPRPQTLFLPGAGHFFHGRLNDLKAAVRDFVPPYL
jgi:alpha/beta superfamily hydrolase